MKEEEKKGKLRANQNKIQTLSGKKKLNFKCTIHCFLGKKREIY